MKNSKMGIIFIVISIALISLQTYSLIILQYMELSSGIAYKLNVFEYIKEPNIVISFVLDFLILFIGVYYLIKDRK